MCNFKSGVCVRDEREKFGIKIYMSPWTESHEELIRLFKLRDTGENLARFEFSPRDYEKAHVVEDNYVLKIDQGREPSWWQSVVPAVTEKMEAYIKSIVVGGDVDLLCGGQFIVAPGAKISCLNFCAIASISGGTISNIRGGTISDIRGGTISDISKNAKIGIDHRKASERTK